MDISDIAGYKGIRQLGSGGMGQVYLVQHPRLPRQDALKLLDAGVSRSEDFKARFQREADLLAQLSHPNIVTLHDRGEFEDRLWITMEYVEGTDAGELLKEHGPAPMNLVLTLIGGAGAALDYAWRKQKITHRDVKPANILVALDGDEIEAVKLADFGIAKAAGEATSLTSTGITVGTMSYISPEAIEGEDLDNRADVYSLGCTAFHLLTGRPPFEGKSMAALMSAHLSREVPQISEVAPHLPTDLDAVFAKVLAKKPDERFQSCGEFVAALAAAGGGAAAPDPAYMQTTFAASAPTVIRKAAASEPGAVPATWLGLRRPVVLGAAAVVLIAAVGAGLAIRSTGGGSGDRVPAAASTVTTTVTVPPSIAMSKETPAPTTTTELFTTTAQIVAPTTTTAVAAPATPTVVRCLEGTPGPALWSDGTEHYSEYCYQKNGGPAYARAEEAANAPVVGSPCNSLGTRSKTATGYPVICDTNDYYRTPTWLGTG